MPARSASTLFSATALITGAAFFVTQVLLVYFSFRYRSQPKRSSRFVTGSNKLELIWTIVPAICFTILFVWGQVIWSRVIARPIEDSLQIEVVGEQFKWKARYAGLDHRLGRTSFGLIRPDNPLGLDTLDPNARDDFIPVQMHVPRGRPVNILLRSKDVIHSFYIPQFRTKMDAVPGMHTRMQFTAIHTTEEMKILLHNPHFEYEVACAELCGKMHFAMKIILVVDEPREFDRWYKKQKPWTYIDP